MTNEELALAAAQGDTESLHKLYFAVAPLIYKLTSRYFTLCYTTKRGVSPEDLVQCGYFAYLGAVKAFSPEKGLTFSSYLTFQVQNVCREELGFRGKKQVETVSLDAPVSVEDDDITLQDALADPNADIFENADLNEMQIIVRQAVERLFSEERTVIYETFYKEKTTEEIASEFGWSRGFTRRTRYAAYKHLRQSEAIQALKKAYGWRSDKYLSPEDFNDFFEDSGLTPIGDAIWK